MTQMRQFRRALRSIAGKPLAYQISDGFGAGLSPLLERVARGHRIHDADILDAFAVSDIEELTAQAAKLAAPTIIPTNKGKSVAIVSMRGIAMYDVEYQPLAFSTLCLARTIAALTAEPTVGTIILDCDSPGGAVTGTQEAADAVWAARQSGKTVVALVSPLCASAAYWICSQANEIVGVPSADIGSIGVFMAHTDCSGAMEQAGLKVTYIFAGKYKVEGNPYEALSEEAQAYYQSEVDTIYANFLKAVSRGRGIPVATVQSDFGQGRTMTAPAAKRAGMIDRVATIDLALGRYGVSAAEQGDDAARRRRRGEAEDLAPEVEATAAEFAEEGAPVPEPQTEGTDDEQPVAITLRTETGSIYLVGDWPKKTQISRTLLDEKRGEVSEDGDFVHIALANGGATYKKISDDGDVWVGKITGTSFVSDSRPDRDAAISARARRLAIQRA